MFSSVTVPPATEVSIETKTPTNRPFRSATLDVVSIRSTGS
jgi:hypothetical protein